jgi:hypothetical protein
MLSIRYTKIERWRKLSFERNPCLTSILGRWIAQAISRWFPTAAARAQTRVQSCGICGGQSGAGVGFLRVLWLPLPIFIPPISPQSPSPIIRGWYNRTVVAAVPKVPPHRLKKSQFFLRYDSRKYSYIQLVLIRLLIKAIYYWTAWS